MQKPNVHIVVLACMHEDLKFKFFIFLFLFCKKEVCWPCIQSIPNWNTSYVFRSQYSAYSLSFVTLLYMK